MAEDAEKYTASSLKTIEGKLESEEVTIYGITYNSQYIKIDLKKQKRCVYF